MAFTRVSNHFGWDLEVAEGVIEFAPLAQADPFITFPMEDERWRGDVAGISDGRAAQILFGTAVRINQHLFCRQPAWNIGCLEAEEIDHPGPHHGRFEAVG